MRNNLLLVAVAGVAALAMYAGSDWSSPRSDWRRGAWNTDASEIQVES